MTGDGVAWAGAVEEIKRLKARYYRFLDFEEWGGFRSLFVDDATFDVEGMLFADADAFVAGIVRHHTLARVRTVHHGHMPEIEIVDDRSATGIWAMWDYVDRIWEEDGRREAFFGYGHYHEHYRRSEDRWRISEMRLTRLRVDWIPPTQLAPFPERDVPVLATLPPQVKSEA